MLKKLWQNNLALALLAGFANVLAFAPICIWPLIVITPLLLFVVADRAQNLRQALLYGYLCSLVIMVGGFYWVVYTIHIFGALPWVVAALLFLLFCGFGAMNFPVFTALVFYLKRTPLPRPLRYIVVYPALFTVVEWTVPKLFPWAIAHTYYFLPVFIQIAELTGASILSFATCCLGGFLLWRWTTPRTERNQTWALLPIFLWTGIFLFGALRLGEAPPETKPLRIAMVQANIGSLDRLEASQGVGSRIKQTVDRHKLLTEKALAEPVKPQLILWPETAVPFLLNVNYGYAFDLKKTVKEWNVPLITGAYAEMPGAAFRDSNAAYLLTPTADGQLDSQIYEKNILLAFGEYFPFGDRFPVLYRWFPQVSNFRWGTEQPLFYLTDGTAVGVTICYEAIVPSFVRKVAGQGIQLLVNLTNDSWFGPTSEPYQHSALSVFRAVESRVPMIRVTNTGKSLTVDRLGHMGPSTPVYEPAYLTTEIQIPTQVQSTLFIRWGNWFVWLLGISLILLVGAKHVPVLSRITSRR